MATPNLTEQAPTAPPLPTLSCKSPTLEMMSRLWTLTSDVSDRMSFDRMMPLIVFFSEEKTVRGIDRLVAASAQIEYSRLRRAKAKETLSDFCQSRRTEGRGRYGQRRRVLEREELVLGDDGKDGRKVLKVEVDEPLNHLCPNDLLVRLAR